MTTYFVGIGGNDGSDGTTWANRKLTLNGAEDIPVAAGDTVYVGPGTYRELLTCDVSGTSGNPITYIGDYTGANTDGIGGIVRITGSDNDQVGARNYAVNVNSKDYRTFSYLLFNGCISSAVYSFGNYFVLNRCHITGSTDSGLVRSASGATNATISNCFIRSIDGDNRTGILIVGGSAYASASTITNCIIVGGSFQYYFNYAGGVTVKNCKGIHAQNQAFRFLNQHADYPSTITNCIINGNTGIYCNAASIVTEDYNNIVAPTARTNVAVGGNSNTFIALFDTRWWWEMINGGRMLSPYDLSSDSELVGLAGTSPTSTDMRGTSAIDTVREWGALEYDSTLEIEAGSGGTSSVKILPLIGRVGL